MDINLWLHIYVELLTELWIREGKSQKIGHEMDRRHYNSLKLGPQNRNQWRENIKSYTPEIGGLMVYIINDDSTERR